MNPGPIPGRDEHDRFFDQVVSQYGAPAYVRRGRRVEEAFQGLLDNCQVQRVQWLTMATLRMGQLAALAGDLDRLAPLLEDPRQVDVLRTLHADMPPKLRVVVAPTTSVRQLRVALRDLRDSIERFNRRWDEYLGKIDLCHVNELRAGYNRYYLLEKECAMRSPTLACIGFRRLEPLTRADVEARLPPLPLPRVRKQ